IGALALTQGSNLYFAQGQYNPHTSRGRQLLGHELAHVVQQRAGRVRNPFASGVAVVQDRALETEADRMGLRAAAHQISVQAKMVGPVRGTLMHTAANHAATPSTIRSIQASSGWSPRHASVVQCALTFTTKLSRWRDDSRGQCQWCGRAIGKLWRHHC